MAKKVKPSRLSKYFSRFLVLVVLLLTTLIVLKGNANIRDFVYQKVFNNNIAFAKINAVYQKYFGSPLPLSKKEEAKEVSKEKLDYTKKEKYKDGVKLTVKENYAVPNMDSGIVVFAGNREGYGNTVIVQRPDDIEVWYANLKDINIELYDYLKAGDIIGEVNDKTLYMVFMQNGKALDYQKYI